MYGLRLFTIGDSRWGDLGGELLVYAPAVLAAFDTDGDQVTIAGRVERGALADIARMGWRKVESDVVDFLSKAVVIARNTVGTDRGCIRIVPSITRAQRPWRQRSSSDSRAGQPLWQQNRIRVDVSSRGSTIGRNSTAAVGSDSAGRRERGEGSVGRLALATTAVATAGAVMLLRPLWNARLGRRSPSQLRAREMMLPNPACCSPLTTLDEVAQLMRHGHRREMTIVDTAGRPIGVITVRDIVDRVVAEGKNPMAHAVHEAMTRPIVTVGLRTPLTQIVTLLVEHRISRVPVVDDRGTFAGIVSRSELARGMAM